MLKKLNDWLNRISWEWANRATATASVRAQQKLGLVSGTLLSPLFGTGIPAFVVSRAIIYSLIAAVAWWGVGKYNTSVTNARDLEWIEKLEEQKKEAREELRRQEKKTSEEILKVEAFWKEQNNHIADYSRQIDLALKEANSTIDAMKDKELAKVPVPPKAVNLIREKVRRINGRPLK